MTTERVSDIHPPLREFERHPNTDALAEVLRGVASGQEITYAHLTAEIGDDVQAEGRHYLQSARRILGREDRIFFHTVRGYGLRRATDSSLVEEAPVTLSRLRRVARSQGNRLRAADWERLTPDERRQWSLHLSIREAVAHASSKRGVEKVLSATSEHTKSLGRKATLRALLEG